MERDERRRADALDRYWDATQRGEAPRRPSDVDEAAATVVDHLGGSPAPPEMHAARLRVRQRIVAAANTTEETMHASALPLPHADRIPRPSPVRARPTIGHRLHTVARLGLAALLLVTLAAGYARFGPARTRDGGPANIPGAAIPATAASTPTATPVPIAATARTLLTLAFPADALRRDGAVSAGLGHFSIPPGNRSTWTPYCCPGPLVEYVVAGVYTVRAEAAIRVVRADGTTEEIASGTEAVLGPGDALVSRNETVVEGANTGTAPVDLLGWVLIGPGGGVFGGHSLPGWTDHNADVQDGLTVPPGGATVHLRRVELDADAVYPAPPGGVFSFAVTLQTNAAGTPAAGYGRKGTDGALAHAAGGPVTFYLLTLEPSGPDGTPTAGAPGAGTPTP